MRIFVAFYRNSVESSLLIRYPLPPPLTLATDYVGRDWQEEVKKLIAWTLVVQEPEGQEVHPG